MGFPEHATTSRLDLRRWREADREEFAAIWADPAVWRSLKGDRPFDPSFANERFDHHLRHWDQHGFGLWASEVRESGTVAGWAGAAHPTAVPELAGEIEIGWTLRQAWWGEGLAFEGAKASIEAAFEHLKIERVISIIHPANERSVSVGRRLGMSGTEPLHRTTGGDLVRIYSLTRAER